jgi:hypothetical protein
MSEKKPTNRSEYVAPQDRVFGTSLNLPSRDDIANLAYTLWEARGGEDRRAEEDWLEAERILLEQGKPTSKGHAA